MMAVLATLAIAAALPLSASAQPLHDTPSGRIVAVDTNRPSYNPDTEAAIQVEIENNGDVTLVYRADVLVLDPSGDVAYNSEKEDVSSRITLVSGSARAFTFYWEIPGDAEEGIYTITAVLKDWDDAEIVYDEVR